MMRSFVSDPARFLSKALLALDLFLWFCRLPVMLRSHSIPRLLQGLARGPRYKGKTSTELKDVVAIMGRICELRLFRSRFFPKRCLSQSLALYRTLGRMGYPVEIHFGALKNGGGLYGHSWVTLNGKTVFDTADSELFTVIYTYPPERSDSFSVASAWTDR
jgi:hypothetical protein